MKSFMNVRQPSAGPAPTLGGPAAAAGNGGTGTAATPTCSSPWSEVICAMVYARENCYRNSFTL